MSLSDKIQINDHNGISFYDDKEFVSVENIKEFIQLLKVSLNKISAGDQNIMLIEINKLTGDKLL